MKNCTYITNIHFIECRRPMQLPHKQVHLKKRDKITKGLSNIVKYGNYELTEIQSNTVVIFYQEINK
jgi:hypothetical protein